MLVGHDALQVCSLCEGEASIVSCSFFLWHQYAYFCGTPCGQFASASFHFSSFASIVSGYSPGADAIDIRDSTVFVGLKSLFHNSGWVPGL